MDCISKNYKVKNNLYKDSQAHDFFDKYYVWRTISKKDLVIALLGLSKLSLIE